MRAQLALFSLHVHYNLHAWPWCAQGGVRQAVASLTDHRTSTCRTLFRSLSTLEMIVIIALKRLVDRGVVPCQTEAIWKEYEEWIRKHPEMAYKFSQDVLHKVGGEETRG